MKPTADEIVLLRIKEALRIRKMYVVKATDNGEPIYIVYQQHPNPDIKKGIGIGRRKTLEGLRIFTNHLIDNPEHYVKSARNS